MWERPAQRSYRGRLQAVLRLVTMERGNWGSAPSLPGILTEAVASKLCLHSAQVPLHLREIPSKLREVHSKLREVPSRLREVPSKLREIPSGLREVPSR